MAETKTFSFELNSTRYIVRYVERKGFHLLSETKEGGWQRVLDYVAGVLRPPDVAKLVADVFEGKFEKEHPGAALRAMVGFFANEESPSFKPPRFAPITDPALIDGLAKLQAFCAQENIVIAGDFTVWVGDFGYDQLDHLSGETLTHWNRSKGQVRE